jgi:hypothetical protein
MDEIDTGAASATERWAARPFLLAGLGLATGIAAQLILGENSIYTTNVAALQGALVLGVTLGAVLIGFTIKQNDWLAPLAFGVVLGAAAGLVTWWNGSPSAWSQGEIWRTMSLLLAVAIAAPLFQAVRDESAWRPSYPTVYDHLWANVVLWCACWAFVLLVFLMSWLLAGLFQLIKINLLHDLLEKNWFCRALIGLAFGSALGVLREHDAVVRTLQRVITTLLAVLAPALAIGLGLFLLALPFTGVKALWDATSATTPLLLACAAGALIFCNDVIGAREADERRNPLLRYSAMLLAAVILPLGGLATVATGLRISQYGYTPERLWAMVFVTIACLWGAAYLVALVRGRMRWAERVRPTNLVLAAIVCVLGLVLATPLISFNRISTDDQLARLESGKIPAAKFDWAALAFDFGKPGRDALERLRKSSNPAVRAKAEEAAKAESRWDLRGEDRNIYAFTGGYDVRPAGATLPEPLKQVIIGERACQSDNLCRIYLHDPKTATVIDDACAKLAPEKRSDPKDKCTARTNTYVLIAEGWKDINDIRDPVNPEAKPLPKDMPAAEERLLLEREYVAISGNGVTVRKVEMRQVYIGDTPEGRPFK